MIETSSLATLTTRLGDIYFIYLLIFRSFVRFARAFTVLDRPTWIRGCPVLFLNRSRSIPFKTLAVRIIRGVREKVSNMMRDTFVRIFS